MSALLDLMNGINKQQAISTVESPTVESPVIRHQSTIVPQYNCKINSIETESDSGLCGTESTGVDTLLCDTELAEGDDGTLVGSGAGGDDVGGEVGGTVAITWPSLEEYDQAAGIRSAIESEVRWWCEPPRCWSGQLAIEQRLRSSLDKFYLAWASCKLGAVMGAARVVRMMLPDSRTREYVERLESGRDPRWVMGVEELVRLQGESKRAKSERGVRAAGTRAGVVRKVVAGEVVEESVRAAVIGEANKLF